MKVLPLIDPAEAVSLALPEAALFVLAGIVSRTVLQTPGVRVILFALGAGQELTEHTNARRALVQVVRGACRFQYAGEWQRLEAGALVHLPPKHPHAVQADGECMLLVTLVTEPASMATAATPAAAAA